MAGKTLDGKARRFELSQLHEWRRGDIMPVVENISRVVVTEAERADAEAVVNAEQIV